LVYHRCTGSIIQQSSIREREIYRELIQENSRTSYRKTWWKPGVIFRFSKIIEADKLPHPIEGMHAQIHASSEGYLDLQEFRDVFERCLYLHKIPFKKYE